jgi:hypothetical protein
MPLFVGRLLMWPLKSGRLHIVFHTHIKYKIINLIILHVTNVISQIIMEKNNS